jgi:hypothetical protein
MTRRKLSKFWARMLWLIPSSALQQSYETSEGWNEYSYGDK